MLKNKKILIGISGGIAAYKTCELVRLFIKAGADVRVIMTPSAAKFVSPYTLSVLSKNEVLINLFSETEDFSKVDSKTWHVNYGIWADLFIIAPATCNTIGKIVTGISDNLLLTTVLSSRCPIMIAPSMDDDMFKHQVIQDNIKKLKELGYKVLQPEQGELASGLYGYGRMPELQTIFDEAQNLLLKKKDLTGKKVLVTAGPTVEYIDAVRYITNPSTGKMGFEIARAAQERGAEVTLVTGPVNLNSPENIKRIDVKSADEMLNAVKSNIKKTNYVIMSAAVEDLKPVSQTNKKLKKESLNKKFSIEFEKSVDILKYLGEHKNGYKLVGFALETDNELKNAREKLQKKNLDFIVLNNPNEKGAGFEHDTNKVKLIDKKSIMDVPLASKYEVANKILDKLIKG
jgi:phosphopantothenoylcysteine decarboxylase/phosphopantothenate--cysteine ligase